MVQELTWDFSALALLRRHAFLDAAFFAPPDIVNGVG